MRVQIVQARVLVIGLGGGGLPMFLHNHLPLRVKVNTHSIRPLHNMLATSTAVLPASRSAVHVWWRVRVKIQKAANSAISRAIVVIQGMHRLHRFRSLFYKDHLFLQRGAMVGIACLEMVSLDCISVPFY